VLAMHNIFLLSSVHREVGNCNSVELIKIIEAVNPDVIFEELDKESFEDHYGLEGPYSTETKAIYEYLKQKTIKHIPVDTYDMSDFSKIDKEYMDNIIFNCNEEYRNLLGTQLKMLNLYGFKFVNSKESIDIIIKLQNIENAVQIQMNDPKLTKIYKRWVEINNERENEFIKNVRMYCAENIFNVGLLITGAEHRKTLIEKINNHENNNPKITWNYCS